MKKLLAALTLMGAVCLGGPVARASDIVLPSSSVVNTVLAVTQNTDLDLNANHIDSLSVQVVYSSANPSAITLIDGTAGSGNLRVVNSALSSLTTAYATNQTTVTQSAGTKASVQATVVSTTGLSGVTLQLGPNVFTADTDYATSGVSTTVAAKNLARLIQAFTIYTATNVANVVYATATTAGNFANDYPAITSNSNKLSVSAATFTGGVNKSLSGQKITVSAGGIASVMTEGADWTQMDTASNTAISINTVYNRRFSSVFTSTVAAGSAVIYSTAVAYGSAVNAYTMACSTGAITFNAATFTGGQDNAIVTIAGRQLIHNTDWFAGSSSVTAARSIAAAINSKMASILVSTNAGGVMYATATIVGTQTNYPLVVSSATALVLSGANMTGGVGSDITLTSPTNLLTGFFGQILALPGSSYGATNTVLKTPTGLGVGSELLFTKSAGTSPSPLVAGTTYFASNLTATTFQLIDTSTGAVAGLSLTITTTTMTGGGSFTLTPLALSGTPTFKLQASNDGTNFQDVYVSTNALVAPFAASVSFASPYTASNQIWTLGDVTYKWLRLAFTKATHGGVSLNYLVNGKRK